MVGARFKVFLASGNGVLVGSSRTKESQELVGDD